MTHNQVKQKNVTCHDVYGKTYQVPLDQLSFRPTVRGIIVKNDKTLLIKQWDGYDFPGGGIRFGEIPEDALIREVKEETGLIVKSAKILHCESGFFKLPFKGNFVQELHLFYKCEIIGGNLSTRYLSAQEKKYVDELVWVPISKIQSGKVRILTLNNPSSLFSVK